MTLLAPAVEQVRQAVERRGLTEAEVARMAGVTPRTVQRLLRGETCGQETLERVCLALGVPLDLAALVEARVLARVRQATRQDRTGPAKVGQDRTQPVYGWGQAAIALGVTRRSLHRYRREAGDLLPIPWWEDRAALVAWFRELRDGLTDPGSSDE